MPSIKLIEESVQTQVFDCWNGFNKRYIIFQYKISLKLKNK